MTRVLIGVVATLSIWENSLLSFMLAQQYFKPENVNANEGGDDAAAANDEEGAVNAAAVAELKLLPRLT